MRYFCKESADSPITLEMAKAHLKVNVSSDDVLIKSLIDDVTSYAERITSRDTRKKIWYAYDDSFPSLCWELRRHPVDTVDEVRYPVLTVQTVVASSVYEIQKLANYSLLILSYGETWPTNGDIITDAVRITFTTKADPRTSEITSGMLRHLSYLYENRGDDDQIIDPTKFRESRFHNRYRIPQI